MICRADKRLVRSIYVMRCGYCQISEPDAGSELTYDHFQPQAQGGSDDVENLVYACHACNEFKGEYFGETDETRLLHPLRDELERHLRLEADGSLRGLTPAGQRYIERLQLKRSPLVRFRLRELQNGGWAAHYQAIASRLEQITARIERIEERIRSRRR